MRKHIGISAIALGVALAASSPANAQLLTLGGSGDAPAVSVDLGTDTGVTVDLGGSPDVSVDVNSSTGGDVTLDVPLGDSGSDLGDTIDLDDSDNTVGVDLDSDGDDNDVTVGLPTNDNDTVYVDLFGKTPGKRSKVIDLNGNNDAVVNLDLEDEDVIIDLFGDGEESADAVVDLDLLDDGDGIPALGNAVDLGDVGLDLDGLLGGESILDLFGEGGTVETIDLGDLSLPNIGFGDENWMPVPGIALPAIGALPSSAAPAGDDGDDGSDGDNGSMTVVVIDPSATDPNPPSSDNNDFRVITGTQLADNDTRSGGTTITTVNRATARAPVTVAANAKAKCFTPDDSQIAHLVGSRTYSNQAVSSWQSAETVTVVPVRLCPEARVRVSEVTYADANMATMRNGVAASPAIRQKLSGTGVGADDVLAVDKKGGELVVYIY